MYKSVLFSCDGYFEWKQFGAKYYPNADRMGGGISWRTVQRLINLSSQLGWHIPK